MPSPLGTVKAVVKSTLASPPVWRFAHRSRKPGCVVLLYHRIGRATDLFPNLDVATFAAQMRWLRANCDPIAPEHLQRRAVDGRSRGDRPAVLVTFDDGYRDYYQNAYPVLKACRIRALNFLCTRFVDHTDATGWWDRLHLALKATRRTSITVPWAPEPFVLDQAGRAEFGRCCKLYVKSRPEREKEAITGAVFDLLGVDGAALTVPRQTMTWDEVRAASDVTSYGGHTHTHAIVSQLDAETLDYEIRTCRDRIQSETGEAPRLFAYPNGRATDFDAAAKAALRRHGFDIAFSAIDGLNDATTDWTEVRRISPGDSVAELAWRLSRVWN